MTSTSPPGLDLDRLREYLHAELPGLMTDEPIVATLLPVGRSNITYRIRHGGNDWALRRPPLGHIMPSAHDVGREHRVLTGLSTAGYPVPRPLLYCDDGEIIGASFMLMEFVPGQVIADEATAARLSPTEADELCAAFVSTLADLHAVDVAAAGLSELGRPVGYLQRQVRRWSAQWRNTMTRELPEIDTLIGWLEPRIAALPTDLPWSVVHGDYRLDNLIVDTDPARVRAVLDWEMSTVGDPVSDLAVALVYWSEEADTLRRAVPVAERVTVGAGFWTREQVVERYAALSGSSLDHLDDCLVLACLKLAVIMESIHRRTLLGQQVGTAAEDVGAMGRATEALARMGVALTHGGGVAALTS